MAVVAALKILLYGYTGEEDLRVATFVARRQRRELEAVMGLFSDAVILRTDLGGDPPCREVLRRVRATTLEAQAHWEVPFHDLARALGRERGLSGARLSQVMVIWQNAFHLSPELAAPPLAFLEMDQGWLAPDGVVSAFDLTFELREARPGLAGSCLYSTGAIDAPAVRRLLDDLHAVLEAMAARPDQRLAVFRGLRDRGEAGIAG